MNRRFLLIIGLLLCLCLIPHVDASQPKTIEIESSTSDGTMYLYDDIGYITVWNWTEGSLSVSLNTTYIGQKNDYVGGVFDYDYIWRSVLLFDTQDLTEDMTIKSATLHFYGETIFHNKREFNITIQSGNATHPHDPLEVGDYFQLHYSGSGGSLSSTDFNLGWNVISLTDFNTISKNGITRLVLRSDRDINAEEPPNNSYEYVIIHTSESIYAPYLMIEYIEQPSGGHKIPTPPWERVPKQIGQLLRDHITTPFWNMWTQLNVTFEGILATIVIVISFLLGLELYHRIRRGKKKLSITKIKIL